MADTWKMMEGESYRAADAFALYRQMGQTRSYKEVAVLLQHKSSARIRRWAKRFKWDERLQAAEEEVRRQVEEERLAAEKRRLQRFAIEKDRVLEEVAAIGYSDIRDILSVDEEGRVAFLPSETWSKEAAASVQSVKVSTKGNGETTVEMRQHPKLPALTKIGQHLEMWGNTESDKSHSALKDALSLIRLVKDGAMDDLIRHAYGDEAIEAEFEEIKPPATSTEEEVKRSERAIPDVQAIQQKLVEKRKEAREKAVDELMQDGGKIIPFEDPLA